MASLLYSEYLYSQIELRYMKKFILSRINASLDFILLYTFYSNAAFGDTCQMLVAI